MAIDRNTHKENSSIDDRYDKGDTIAQLLFYPKVSEKSSKSLHEQSAMDKIKTIVYFLGYKAMLKFSEKTSFREIKDLLNSIYQCRNMNHRGSSQSEWQNNIIAKIIPLKSFYYFKFLGVLAQYIEYIKEGWKSIPELKKYSESIDK